MGLDMYLYKGKRTVEEYKKIDKEQSIVYDQLNDKIEIGYWRKHPNLHGYIEKLFYQRGGTEIFNCELIELTEEDIQNIIKLSKENALPITRGFFFGESEFSDDKETIKIMENALKEIKQGYKIFYNSWW